MITVTGPISIMHSHPLGGIKVGNNSTVAVLCPGDSHRYCMCMSRAAADDETQTALVISIIRPKLLARLVS